MASILKPLIDLGRQANFPFLYFFSLFLSVISTKFVSIKIQKKSAEQWKINLWITVEMITLLNLNIEPNICQ